MHTRTDAGRRWQDASFGDPAYPLAFAFRRPAVRDDGSDYVAGWSRLLGGRHRIGCQCPFWTECTERLCLRETEARRPRPSPQGGIRMGTRTN